MTDEDAVPDAVPIAVPFTDADVVAVTRTMRGGAVPDPFPAISRKRRRGVRVTSAAAIALGLALGGWSVAGATTSSSTSNAPSGSPGSSSAAENHPPGGGSPPTAVGTVATVGDGTFTLTTNSETTDTVDVSSTTTYLDHGVTSPTIADVTHGEHVAVFGTSSSGVITATSVAIGLPPNGGKGAPPGGGKGAPPGGGKSAPSNGGKGGPPTGTGGPPGGGNGSSPPAAPSGSSSS
jgi:hypothetical protein